MVGLVPPFGLMVLGVRLIPGLLLLLLPFVRRVLVVGLSKQTLTCQTN